MSCVFRVRVLPTALILAASLSFPAGALFAADAPGRATARGGSPAGVSVHLTAEEQALLAIQDDAVRRVQALVERMRGVPRGPALDALQRQIVAVKQESEIAFLRAKLGFATRRGDLAAMHEIEDAIAARVNPPLHVMTGPLVTKPVADAKDGAR